MASKVFISYRREDSRYQAHRIYDAFIHALPADTVFMDVDSISPGADFVEILEGWVKQCDVLLALIGPSWINSIDPRTNLRRLENPEDFVRIEIRGALARKIPVVPVLLDAAEMPSAEQLPDDIKALRRRHAEFVDFRTFDADVERLIKKLRIGKNSGLLDGAPGSNSGSLPDHQTAVSRPDASLKQVDDSRNISRSLLRATVAALLLVSAAASVVIFRMHADAAVGAAELAEAKARIGEVTETLTKSEKAREAAEATVTAAGNAQAKAEDGRRAAQAEASQAVDALAKSEKARRDAEARAMAAEARASQTSDALKISEKARQDAEASATNAKAAQAKAEEGRTIAEAQSNQAIDALAKSEKVRRDAEAFAAATPPKGEEGRRLAEAQASNIANAEARADAAPLPQAQVSRTAPLRTPLGNLGSNSRWATGDATNCGVPKKAYTLELGASLMTWRNGEGNVDIEAINSSSGDEIRTTTQASVHPGGTDEKAGQTWTYSRDGGRVRVQPLGKGVFMLSRCS